MHENTLKFVVLCIVSWHQSTGLALESLPDILKESGCGRGGSPKVAILCDCSNKSQPLLVTESRVTEKCQQFGLYTYINVHGQLGKKLQNTDWRKLVPYSFIEMQDQMSPQYEYSYQLHKRTVGAKKTVVSYWRPQHSDSGH